MKERVRAFTPTLVEKLCLLACITFLGSCCCLRGWPEGPVDPGATPLAFTCEDREMAALAFIAYAGDSLSSNDRSVEKTLRPCVKRELDKQPITRDRWELVWGPAVFKFRAAKLDDNMMFVVRGRGELEHVVTVVIRGTNPDAALDWIKEDFEVLPTVEWPYLKPPDPNVRLSHATNVGLGILQDLKPTLEPKVRLREFLGGLVRKHSVDTIKVTGHSLAGALVPALALWLHDTRADWTDEEDVAIRVTTVAGPTAGNEGFARHYDRQLGGRTRRLHNPFDVVPQAWTVEDMRHIPGLYAPRIPAHCDLEAPVCVAIDLVKDARFTQILAAEPPLRGAKFTHFEDDGPFGKEDTFFGQVGLQHHCGYLCAMEMREMVISGAPVTPPGEEKGRKPCYSRKMLPVTATCDPREPATSPCLLAKKLVRCPAYRPTAPIEVPPIEVPPIEAPGE